MPTSSTEWVLQSLSLSSSSSPVSSSLTYHERLEALCPALPVNVPQFVPPLPIPSPYHQPPTLNGFHGTGFHTPLPIHYTTPKISMSPEANYRTGPKDFTPKLAPRISKPRSSSSHASRPLANPIRHSSLLEVLKLLP